MKMIKKDCFFVEIPEDEFREKVNCKILKTADCKNCSFYKKKEHLKNNVFYKESFNNKEEYIEELNKYKEKYKEDISYDK